VAFCSWRDVWHPEAGGSEVFLERVATRLVDLGCEVSVVTAAYAGAPASETRDGVRYLRAGGRKGVYAQAARRHVTGRLRDADVVVDVQNGVPFLSPLFTATPVVNLVHHVHREQWPVVFGPRAARVGWWLESRVSPAVYRRSAWVAVSEATRRELAGLGVDPAAITVVHNGTDAGPVLRTSRSPHPSLIVLSRLVPHKRIELAIDAVAELREAVPGLTLTVVGSGWWHDALVRHVRAVGATDSVTFTGHVDDATKHELLGRAWAMVVPSVKEGWGLSVVEAGMHRTPAVAFTGAGGLSESIVDGVTGLLVDGRHATLTAALRDVLLDRACATAWVRRRRRTPRRSAGTPPRRRCCASSTRRGMAGGGAAPGRRVAVSACRRWRAVP
jgi:glycosyltransferase involved in cell wall biosynthesis